MIGIIMATGLYMIVRNGIVVESGALLIRPLILTVLLAAVYFGSRKLKKGGISWKDIAGYRDEEYTHMNVAAAVLSGRADVGLGVRSAAQALGLDFVPVGMEEYDLVIAAAYAGDKRVLALLSVIRSDGFKEAALAMGGYDVGRSGEIAWEYDGC